MNTLARPYPAHVSAGIIELAVGLSSHCDVVPAIAELQREVEAGGGGTADAPDDGPPASPPPDPEREARNRQFDETVAGLRASGHFADFPRMG